MSRIFLLLLSIWVLIARFPSFGGERGGLKPGIYHNLTLSEPVVLGKGSYTFIGLEMRCKVFPPGRIRGPELVWIDAMKATEVHFENCTFTQISRGTVLRLAGKVTINNCRFVGTDWESETLERGKPNQNMGKTGIEYHQGEGITLTNSTLQNLNYGMVFYGSTTSGTRTNSVTENLFANNEQNLRFKSNYKANFKLNLKCNTFTTPTNPAPFTNRYGMWVEAGAEMPDIGGTGINGQIPPSANWWPVAGTTNSTLSPWPVTNLSGGGGVEHWFSPTGWETVHNLTEDVWSYFRYKNEFFGTFQDMSISQGFEITEVNRMVRSRSDQVIPSGELFDDACSNFGQVLVFPTRPAVSQDSTLTQKSGSFSGSADFLDQNIPNPAANSTTIGYRLPSDAKAAKLELFELSTGRIVKSVGIPVSGHGQVELGLHGIPGGVYGYRLIAGERPLGWKKMIIVR